MAVLRGVECLLALNFSPLATLPPIWGSVGGQRGATLTVNTALIDTTNKDSGHWSEHLVGIREWSLRFTHALLEADAAQQYCDHAYRAGLPVALQLRTPSPTRFYEGEGTLLHLSMTMPHSEIALVSGEVHGLSPLRKGAAMNNQTLNVGVIRDGNLAESVVSVGTSSTAVIGASSARQSLLLVNTSDTDMYLSLSGDAVVGAGLPLYAYGGSYEMSIVLGNLYAGPITAIHGGTGNKALVVLEGRLA